MSSALKLCFIFLGLIKVLLSNITILFSQVFTSPSMGLSCYLSLPLIFKDSRAGCCLTTPMLLKLVSFASAEALLIDKSCIDFVFLPSYRQKILWSTLFWATGVVGPRDCKFRASWLVFRMLVLLFDVFKKSLRRGEPPADSMLRMLLMCCFFETLQTIFAYSLLF